MADSFIVAGERGAEMAKTDLIVAVSNLGAEVKRLRAENEKLKELLHVKENPEPQEANHD